MTKRHAQIAEFIRTFTGDNGYSPSFKEIAVHLGIRSISTVHKHLQAMREMGVVSLGDKTKNVRSVQVVYARKADCCECEILRSELKQALATIERMRERRSSGVIA